MKTKRSFTKRQMSVVQLIYDKKSAGQDELTLDEIIDHCKASGHLSKVSSSSKRPTVLATMNHLIPRLQKSGIKIEKIQKMGRGAKCIFKI